MKYIRRRTKAMNRFHFQTIKEKEKMKLLSKNAHLKDIRLWSGT
jgi:hypothetical protein